MIGPFASMRQRPIWPIGPTWACSSSISTLQAPLLVGVANLLMNWLSLLELAIHKLSANRGIGVVALPLLPNVVFCIATVRAVQGPIVPQPARAWLRHHLRRLQSRDPRPQHLHVPAASLDAPEVVLSYFASVCSSASVPLSFCSAIVSCFYMLGVGLAVAPLSIKKCFMV